ncbi:MAG: CdaR family protein [Lachnospiraceae bacterium]|nr:CdaR family protein [Lachnospiraceae bacterium]
MKGSEENKERKEAFKNAVLNNIGIKLISVLIALIIWMTIINIDDPYKTRTFSVTVQTINEDALKSVNKVYEVIEGRTANVKVKGKKSVVDKLSVDDIIATADLSDLSSVNAVVIVPALKKHISSDVILECNQVLKVSLENMASKQVKVTVETMGIPEDGYTIGECIAKPNMIEVTGGKSAIEQIDSVKVVLNVNGISEDFTRKLTPAAYDKNGNEVKSSTLSYSYKKVKVVAEVLKDKKIPVKIDVKGRPAPGYEYVGTSCLPEEIKVAGTSKALAEISEVVIPVDITGMTSSSPKLEQNVLVSDYISDNVTVLDDYSTISIKITIEPHEVKALKLRLSDIHFLLLEDGYKAEIISENSFVDIVVSGNSSSINNFDMKDISASINCSGLKEGVYELPLEVKLGEHLKLEKSEKIKVKITKNNNWETNQPEDTKAPDATNSPNNKPVETQQPETGKDDEKGNKR